MSESFLITYIADIYMFLSYSCNFSPLETKFEAR